MKKLIILLLLAGTILPLRAQDRPEGIVFLENERWEEVLQKAKQENKLIFTDCYTSWCGPCKMMATEIFPQAEAGEFFNANFISFKTDAEKSEDGRNIAKDYNVTAYPTFLFVNGDGELVYRFLGAKSLNELIVEGGKALAAQKVYPELKRFEARYNEGDRDMDFLAEYAGVMSASGLDASPVLTDYLAQVDDADLFEPENLARIAVITRYDPALSQRLMAQLERLAADPEKDEKAFARANSSVGKYFGGTIRNITNSGTEQQFGEYIAMKGRFMALGNSNSVSLAMMGGGSFYLPTELLQLDYYNIKGNGARYTEIFDRYMEDVKSTFAEVDAAIGSLKENTDRRIEESLAQGNEAEAKSIRASLGLMSHLVGMDNIYISTTLLSSLEDYDKYYAGVRDDAYNDRLAGWYVYLAGVSPSVKTALHAADKLVAMGHSADAAAVLRTGLDKGSEESEVTPEMIAEAEEKLAKLEAR